MTSAELARTVATHGEAVLPATSDADEVVAACAGTLRPHTLVLRPGARLAAQLMHVPVGGFSVNRLVYGADVMVSPAVPEDDNFLLTLPVAGRARFRYGRSTATATAARGVIVGPYRAFEFAIDGGFDQVIVRLDRSRVEAVAERLTGSPGPVDFQLVLDPAVAGIPGMVASAVQLAATGRTVTRPQMLWQIEQVVIEGLLLCQPNSRSMELGGGTPAPSARLRRALAYLSDHLAEPLSIGTVAAECGVSVRSLQEAFRRELDTTPGRWLRAQRLERAHALLTAGDLSVTEVAYACGFLHLGEFGAAFKARYGTTPSRLRSTRH